jgi:DNA replicative helicase MCM subunit Mcm2 (Cdc46/Mcm family)
MKLSKLSLDEIFGNDSEELNNPKPDEKEKRKLPPDVGFDLPLKHKVTGQWIKSIWVTPSYEIVVKAKAFGLIKTEIFCENKESDVLVDWEKTKAQLVENLNSKIRPNELASIRDSTLHVLDTEKDQISYYLKAIPRNGPLNAIKNHLINLYESDTSDTSDGSEMKIHVSEALKLNSGYVTVKGSIVSISEPFKMVQSYKVECGCGERIIEEHFEVPLYRTPKVVTKKCDGCQNTTFCSFEYINAISLELQDDEQFSDIERLNCILLDTDTASIKIGERVEIRGSVQVINKNQKGNLVLVLFSRNLVQYPNKNDTTISELDNEAIERFAMKYENKIINKLADMFDKSVIGADVAKKALLLSLVSAGDDTDDMKNNIGKRNRIHTLLAGPPGVAKSSLLRKASKLISNSRYESSQHSSGRSLTAIVEKENENHSLRLGPIPLAKKSICALNEIGTIPFEEQKFLLDAMEEGKFTINKYGINSTISSPTTIIASTNLLNSSADTSSFNENIQLTQIPCTPPVRDRFDLIVVMSDLTNDVEILDYVDKKLENISTRIPNYDSFLIKYLQQARELEPILNPSCKNQIKYYYFSLKKSNPGMSSNRVLETLIRLSKAIAKLKLKQVIDEEDVNDAIEFYNALISKYAESSITPSEPDKYAYEKCLEILKDRSDSEEPSLRFDELVYMACMSDGVIRSYVCDSNKPNIDMVKIEKNHKSRQVRDLLVNNPFVSIVNKKPLTIKFEWGMKKQHQSI